MRERVPTPGMASTVEITSATVQRGDILHIGGLVCRVQDLFQLPHGAKQLLFDTGELLTIHVRTHFVAVRMTRRR
ncbi:hypothetical protein [Streptomyces sp. t39]|uniref:hypothetical protein n=1 Tax=Streptomyces sp. t39 TaxID=1828156 RepID=UPI0011CDA6B2|nr:hypothetical protein [Streptomyces sp. t39]TXS55762.1 hypothetical protein EAO77_06035 [Streptomyces sp. t39]